jgi:Flp pilus assembly protein TadG
MTQNALGNQLPVVARLLHDSSGASAMILAVVLPSMIGFSALAVETGMWYAIKTQNQSAADAAAISAAYQVIAGKTDIAADLLPAATEAAEQNAYHGTTPAVSYAHTDNTVTNRIAVTLQQTQGALLASLFISGVTITNTAVATITPLDHPCILALGTTSTDVEMSDSTRLTMPDCGIAANSISRTAVALNGPSSSIVASTIVTAGALSLQQNPVNPVVLPPQFSLRFPPRIGAPLIADPYAGTLTHAFLTTGMPITGNCTPATNQTSTTYLVGNCVVPSPGLIVKPAEIVDLVPGTYWINGDLTVAPTGMLHCSACDNVSGSGVTLILTASASITGRSVSLNAPSAGRFAGLLLLQDAGDTAPNHNSIITGGPGAELNGLIYFPKSSMTFNANPSATGPKCLILVVNSLNINGNSDLASSGCTAIGLTVLPTIATVTLAE